MAVDLDVWSNEGNRETDMDASARERSTKSIYRGSYFKLEVTGSNWTKNIKFCIEHIIVIICSYICRSWI